MGWRPTSPPCTASRRATGSSEYHFIYVEDGDRDGLLTAVLAFLEKTVRSPESVAEGDLAEVRGLGVPDEAIVQALHVNFVWNVVNRLAHAFDYRLSEMTIAAGW